MNVSNIGTVKCGLTVPLARYHAFVDELLGGILLSENAYRCRSLMSSARIIDQTEDLSSRPLDTVHA